MNKAEEAMQLAKNYHDAVLKQSYQNILAKINEQAKIGFFATVVWVSRQYANVLVKFLINDGFVVKTYNTNKDETGINISWENQEYGK